MLLKDWICKYYEMLIINRLKIIKTDSSIIML